MSSDYVALTKRLLMSLCIWVVLVVGTVVVTVAHIHHTHGLPVHLEARALVFVTCLLTPLGVITILAVSAIAGKLRRLAASLVGFFVGALLSVTAAYVMAVYVVGGFESGAALMGIGKVCALPSGAASAIAACLFAKPKPRNC